MYSLYEQYSNIKQDEAVTESAIDSINEALLIEECMSFDNDQLTAFLESDLCKQLVTEGKLRKNSIVILGKDGDLSKRKKLICLSLAKQAKDSDWTALKKNRIKERHLIGKIVKKYGAKADKLAKVSQKDWIKNRMGSDYNNVNRFNKRPSFDKAGGEDR